MTIVNASKSPNTVDIAIVGGGITGLAAAAALPREYRWALFESHSQLGGKVATQHEHVPHMGDFVLEKGPDCLVAAQAENILSLFDQLGLATHILPTTQRDLPVFVWHNSKAVPLPHNTHLSIPTQLASLWRCPLISLQGKLRLCVEPFLPSSLSLPQDSTATQQDESVGHFLQRRLGQQAVDNLAEPLLGNIFQLHPNQQSLLATLPHIHRAFIKHGSLLLGMRAQGRNHNKTKPEGFVTLRNGMGTWVDAWANTLGRDRLHTDTYVQSIHPLNLGGYRLQTQSGQQWHCRCVLFATPAKQAAHILQDLVPQTACCLQALPTTSSASVYMAFANKDLHAPKNGGQPLLLGGAGLLIPHRQARTINAITCVSRKFAHRAPPGYTLLRAAVGGWRNPTLLQQHNEQMICRQVLADLQRFLNTRAQPVLTRLFAWRHSIPQHPVGHLQRIQHITSSLPKGIFLAGSPYAGAGLPNCLAQGQQAAQQIKKHLEALQNG
ncbi:MAG: protoporphyrinogen oxidase [Myxococcota bacterium]